MRIADYEATIKTNSVLIPRLQTIAKDLVSGGPPYFNQLVNRLQEQPSLEAPPHSPEHSYDSMVLSLLNKVYDEVIKEKGVDKKDTEKLGKEILKHFQDHVDKLVKVDADAQTGLKEELEEQKKHITSDDIKEGWDSKVRFWAYWFQLITAKFLTMDFQTVCTAESRAQTHISYRSKNKVVEETRNRDWNSQLTLCM